MRIIILGPQGSGKGTYASRLSPILGIPHISTGDMCREEVKAGTARGKEIEKYVNAGNLVPDEIILQMVKERLKKPDCEKGFIFDGFPRTLNQAKELEKIAAPDVALYLDVPEWILIERLGSRVVCEKCGKIYNLRTLKPKKEGICDECGGKLVRRKDDTPEAIRKRLEEYEKKTKPIVDFYKEKGILKKVSCDKIDIPPDVMVEKILKILGVK
jgi:adenylate kinase